MSTESSLTRSHVILLSYSLSTATKAGQFFIHFFFSSWMGGWLSESYIFVSRTIHKNLTRPIKTFFFFFSFKSPEGVKQPYPPSIL